MSKEKYSSFGFFRKIDIFGDAVPAFNLGGNATIQTHIGACISLLVMMLTLAFGLIKI